MKKMIALLLLTLVCLGLPPAARSAEPDIHLWLPPTWKAHPEDADKLAAALSAKCGLQIIARIATSYPEIMRALTEKEPELAYVGSMVQAVLFARRLAVPLFQAMDGKQNYGCEMIFTKGESPQSILKDSPESVAYTPGATASEVCAKAATGGKAKMGGMNDLQAAADAVTLGTAKAAFVKDSWWDENKGNYPKLDSYRLPEISAAKNPDNVMLASKYVSPEIKSMLMAAAISSPQLFKAELIVPFDSSSLDFTLGLMKKAGIDPLTYTWPE